MSLSIGIVGLPNVGKSTLFQIITKKQVSRENYPFCTVDPNIGVVAVPDERVDNLAKLTHSQRKIYTTVKFVDIAGLVKGANQGEGLGNKFLAQIREVDAIIYVLRAFSNEKIINSQAKVDILEAKEILDTEMALKDLATVDKRLEGMKREVSAGDKIAVKESNVLKKAQLLLAEGKILVQGDWEEEEPNILKSFQLLTFKPRLYLFNGNEREVPPDVLKTFEEKKWQFLTIDILTEIESLELSPKDREELGLNPEAELGALIKACYKLLGLITFFTTGQDETRAWAIKKGSTAPQAGGVIHSDFEDYFIRAEIINWKELLESGGFTGAREKGLIRTEGKDYLVSDGDVIEIKSGR